HHMGKCVGVCTGQVSTEEYEERIRQVILFFRHDHKKIVSLYTEEMEKAAENMEFERAGELRDKIRALQALSSGRQVVRDLHFDADVFGVFADELGGCINILSVREGSVVDSTNFHFGADEIISPESFAALLVSLYRGREMMPREFLLPKELWGEETEVLSQVLSRSGEAKLRLRIPERGEGRGLLQMAEENAKAAALHRRAQFEKDEKVLVSLATLLSLEVLPERIESIDISNSGASAISAGIITVEKGRFLKKAYKSFSIDREAPDDPACMYEAISRRLRRFLEGDVAFAPLPDLILVDGAAAQVAAVKRALSDAALSIPVFGMVKDAFHKTRCLTDGDHDISIAHDAALFQFIYGIQEEVHRFSLSRMDSRRRKSVKTSALTAIEGIGEKKAALLLKQLGSIKAIRSATLEELAGLKGISTRDAACIYEYYHKKENEDKAL
ncbi:MAG: UvrB/UvrC motif-containing protein, partial [Clostridia bacterium]|nr:UvrB/UvrC motif-containing protein [Clostridia bacterium]